MDDDETTLQEAEEEVGQVVADVLAEVAEEFADAVSGADELVAARFSVGSIARMWASRMPRVVQRLLGVAETAAHQAADSVGAELDDTWDDLPGRHEDGRELPAGMGQYVETTEHLLRAVGDRLAEVARQELAAGLEAEEDVDQLRARLLARFAADGPQLGRARQERTAATEASRAWNTATLEAARALSGPDRPLVKQWMCVAPDTPVVASGVSATARRHYTGPLLRLRTASGRSVALTPEHPVLTGRGWLPAQAVHEGDHLFQVTGIDPIGAPGVEHLPTRVGEVVDAAMAASAVQVRTVPGGVDLNGHAVHGDIEVVAADRNLTAHFEPGGGQGLMDLFLTAADVLGETALLTGGDPLGRVPGQRHTALGSGRLSDPPPPGLGGLRGGPHQARSATVPQFDTGVAQDTRDCRLCAAVSGSERGQTCAALVGIDDVRHREAVASACGHRNGLRGTSLVQAGRVTLERETGAVPSGTEGHSGGSQAALNRCPGGPNGGGDLTRTFPGRVAAGHVLDIEHAGIGAVVAPVVGQDRLDAIATQAAGLGDCAHQVAPVEAGQDIGYDVPSGDRRLPGRAHAAQGHTCLDEASGDRSVADPQLAAQLARGGPRLVAPDEVVDVEVTTWSGHVYDLSTAAGWYAADGLVVHNSRLDNRTRDAHRDAHAQLRLLDEPFRVGGHDMDAPGDPSAPASLTVNCRCRLRVARAEPSTPTTEDAARSASYESLVPAGVTPSDVTAAADGSHLMGGMIALIPTEEDAARLAIEGGEDAGELHLTLYFLGEQGGDWTPDQRQELADGVRARVQDLGGPITGVAFGANHWNAGSDSPSWVWAVGDDRDQDDDAPTLGQARALVTSALEDTHERPEIPRQHSPWVAHVCAAYSDDPALLEALEARLGPITFDRVRLAFGGDHIDIPLTAEDNDMANEETAAGLPTRAWSTPGDAALAFENQQTGDGRIFAAGALEWSGGPWPLQYADEMLRGHEGAELAGAINSLGRDGDRITGDGVLYLSQRSGAEAALLLEEGAPLGVSVDLDDVDVEFVDTTLEEDGDGGLRLAASLASLSVMQAGDGSWIFQAQPPASWEASAGIVSRQRQTVELITGPGGRVNASAIVAAFAGTGLVPEALTAAAGDPDDPEGGVVVYRETAGEFLVRITRGRVRGATLVAVPAFAGARIVLDPLDEEETAASAVVRPDPVREAVEEVTAAAEETRRRVVAYVRSSPSPVSPAQVARALGIAVSTARKHLGEAVKTGHLVRLRPGFYVGATSGPQTEATASAGTPGAAAEPTGAPHVHPIPDDVMGDLVASAWSAMQEADPMPAAWFREPTVEELPPGSGGVHYADGRVFGWVAQAGEPHAGYPGRNLTIESLGKIDTTHFLRARFKLDDGTYVKCGAFTMNVPHSRDGAECDTASCQFDDTRTVAAVVTVGLNDRGMWFSGAAAPWLSQWDRTVFTACQPSYHMRQAADGTWQLRAVLSVPVPGHSSPLLAAAVERSNLALAASAAVQTAPAGAGHLEVLALPDQPEPPTASSTPAAPTGDVAAALTDPTALDRLLDALTARQEQRDEERRAEVARLSAAFTA